MNALTPVVARIETTVMRKFPPALVVRLHHAIHQRIGEPELHQVRTLVRPGTIAVDVGGHFGVFSYEMARHIEDGRVITLEPIEEDAAMIEAAATSLRLPITVLHCAASDHDGTAEIHIPALRGAAKTALSTLESRSQTGDHLETRSIPTRTLDHILADVDRPVSFLKIDVEGHELAVLRGATRVLTEHRPNILIEINDDLGDRPITDVFDLILGFGYDGSFLEGGLMRMPLSYFDVDQHQRAHAGHEFSRSYVNNFIFTPAE